MHRRSLPVAHRLVYLQVENPIPFADSILTRGLSTAYLHSRYAALLIFPVQLSADWSCIPLVEGFDDPRNAASAALYAVLAAILLRGLPFGWAKHENSQRNTDSEMTLRYQSFVLLAFLVSPLAPT